MTSAGTPAGGSRWRGDRTGPAAGRPTGQTAMLTLPAEELGALYLGQASALALWRAGRIAGSEEAARAAEPLFRWHPEPWAPEIW